MTNDLPFFRLTALESVCFMSRGIVGYETRQAFATRLSLGFPKGVYVVSVKLDVRAFINPTGLIEILMPPFARVERWQCVNNDAAEVCVCRGFFDPEIKGPWKHRNEPNRHHPLCQLGRHSTGNWTELQGAPAVLAPGVNWRDVHVEQNPVEERA